jgi:hypothetical protein
MGLVQFLNIFSVAIFKCYKVYIIQLFFNLDLRLGQSKRHTQMGSPQFRRWPRHHSLRHRTESKIRSRIFRSSQNRRAHPSRGLRGWPEGKTDLRV